MNTSSSLYYIYSFILFIYTNKQIYSTLSCVHLHERKIRQDRGKKIISSYFCVVSPNFLYVYRGPMFYDGLPIFSRLALPSKWSRVYGDPTFTTPVFCKILGDTSLGKNFPWKTFGKVLCWISIIHKFIYGTILSQGTSDKRTRSYNTFQITFKAVERFLIYCVV